VISVSNWRKKAAPIIAEIMAKFPEDGPKQKKALRDAYPFGERKYHPYKIWCDEIKRQRGVKWPVGHKRAWENSNARRRSEWQRLQEWEAIYGKRSA